MSNRSPIEYDLPPDAALAVVLPILRRLESNVQALNTHVVQHVPRRPIPESVKERHRLIVTALGGRCPCCGLVDVVDQSGRAEGEYDHFYSRERNAFEETWLICPVCHRQMKDRIVFTDEFRSYQRRALAIEGGQLQLI